MGKPTWTNSTSHHSTLGQRSNVYAMQRIMAQTTETQCASDVPVRNLVIRRCSFSRNLERSKGEAKWIDCIRGSNQNDGCMRGCVKWTKRGQASHILVFHDGHKHVMLVQQYRFDMSWQQDPAEVTVTQTTVPRMVWKLFRRRISKWASSSRPICTQSAFRMDLGDFLSR